MREVKLNGWIKRAVRECILARVFCQDFDDLNDKYWVGRDDGLSRTQATKVLEERLGISTQDASLHLDCLKIATANWMIKYNDFDILEPRPYYPYYDSLLCSCLNEFIGEYVKPEEWEQTKPGLCLNP